MVFTGTPVCAGVAMAKVLRYAHAELKAEPFTVDESQVSAELERYEAAVEAADKELAGLIAGFGQEQRDKAKIFAAHRELLRDEEIVEAIRSAIREEKKNCSWAVESVCGMYAQMFEQLEDALLKERAADIRDVGRRLLRLCMGTQDTNLSQLTEPCLVVAHDLLPSDTAGLDRTHVAGIVTEAGGATCHSAIIARSYNIPAVLGVNGVMEHLVPGEPAILDAEAGKLITNPTSAEWEHYARRRELLAQQMEEAERWAAQPGRTADGVSVAIGLNVGDPTGEELEALKKCADYVGLFRTEFMYMEAQQLPDEEAQFQCYRKLAQAGGGKTITLRTLDIGADKTLPYYEMPREENPALGRRALRLCLHDRRLFRTQLRAALRAAAYGEIQIMFPMVSSLDDFLAARDEVEEVKAELRAEGTPFRENVCLGVMIETPSAAMIADILAEHVDFASIGTNDLGQYLMAADRMNSDVAAYCQGYHPALFRLIGWTAAQFNRAGKPIGVCGEMGGDRLAAPVLVGLGMRKLSMSMSRLAEVKMVLAAYTLEELEEVAAQVQRIPTAHEVRAYLEQRLG